jgi:hypothetical protein
MNQTYYPNINVTSPIYIGIIGCKYDYIYLPFKTGSGVVKMHKLDVGVAIVCFDILSFLICMYFFNKIKNLN